MTFLNSLHIFEKSSPEQRKFLRFALSLRAECHYNAGEMAEQCKLVDICSQGLGFELDAPVSMRNGQNVLLKIDVSRKKIPVSAIVKLAWVKIPGDGFMTQRVGSRLLFMDPREKTRLIEHAYAEILCGVTGIDLPSPVYSYAV